MSDPHAPDRDAEPPSLAAGLDSPDFATRVCALVAAIPRGRVSTYGRIAAAAGSARASRTVGWILHAQVASGLPCHRVVNRTGALTGARHFETPFAMEERLRGEGVAFDDDGRVRLDRHLWTPAPRDER